jgi:hypothetical protein
MPPGASRSLFCRRLAALALLFATCERSGRRSLRLHGNWRPARPAHRSALHDAAHDRHPATRSPSFIKPAEVIYAWSTTCATKPSSPRSPSTKPSWMNPPPAAGIAEVTADWTNPTPRISPIPPDISRRGRFTPAHPHRQCRHHGHTQCRSTPRPQADSKRSGKEHQTA